MFCRSKVAPGRRFGRRMGNVVAWFGLLSVEVFLLPHFPNTMACRLFPGFCLFRYYLFLKLWIFFTDRKGCSFNVAHWGDWIAWGKRTIRRNNNIVIIYCVYRIRRHESSRCRSPGFSISQMTVISLFSSPPDMTYGRIQLQTTTNLKSFYYYIFKYS